MQKTEDSLGLTITDNGAGYSFIKRIKEGSVISNIPHIKVSKCKNATDFLYENRQFNEISRPFDALFSIHLERKAETNGISDFQVGDHIEKLNNVNMVGKRHFEVATALKTIPLGSTFTIRLVEPMASGFGQIAPKNSTRAPKKAGYGSGKETLRFKAGGKAEIQEQASKAQ